MNGTSSDTKMVPVVGGSEVNFRKIVFTVYRRKWIILAVALPIILLGGFNLFQQSGSFTASSKVVVELVKVDLPQWDISSRNVDYDRELSTMYNVAMSVPVLEVAATSLKDSIMTILELDPELMEVFEGEDWLLGYLFDGLSVGIVGESRLLDFQFTSTHPRISLMCVGALRDAFLGYSAHGQKSDGAIDYFQEQIGLVRAEMDSLLGERSEILTAGGYTSLKEDLRLDSNLLSDMEDRLLKAETNRFIMEAEYNELKGYLSRDPRDFPMGKDESRSFSLVSWRELVGKHENELHSLLSIYKKDSLPVKRQEELLGQALESLRREQKSYVLSLSAALQYTKAAEVSLTKLLERKRLESSSGPEIYHKVSLLDVEINSLKRLLEDIQAKWGEVRLNQMADERVSKVSPLTNPELIIAFSGGKTMIYFIMVIFLALAMGMVVAFVMDTMDHRLYVPLDVEDHLKLPVFASVSGK